jgi:hypothetical protein
MGFCTCGRHQYRVPRGGYNQGKGRQDKAAQASLQRYRGGTYSDGGEDVLQPVHKSDQTRVVDVDAVTLLAWDPRPHPQMPLEH